MVPRAVKLVADAQENGAIRLLDERAQFVNCRVVCAIGDVIEVLSRMPYVAIRATALKLGRSAGYSSRYSGYIS